MVLAIDRGHLIEDFNEKNKNFEKMDLTGFGIPRLNYMFNFLFFYPISIINKKQFLLIKKKFPLKYNF